MSVLVGVSDLLMKDREMKQKKVGVLEGDE